MALLSNFYSAWWRCCAALAAVRISFECCYFFVLIAEVTIGLLCYHAGWSSLRMSRSNLNFLVLGGIMPFVTPVSSTSSSWAGPLRGTPLFYFFYSAFACIHRSSLPSWLMGFQSYVSCRGNADRIAIMVMVFHRSWLSVHLILLILCWIIQYFRILRTRKLDVFQHTLVLDGLIQWCSYLCIHYFSYFCETGFIKTGCGSMNLAFWSFFSDVLGCFEFWELENLKAWCSSMHLVLFLLCFSNEAHSCAFLNTLLYVQLVSVKLVVNQMNLSCLSSSMMLLLL